MGRVNSENNKMKEVKLQQLNNGQFVLTVPRAYVEIKGWTKGKTLYWKDSSSGLLLGEKK